MVKKIAFLVLALALCASSALAAQSVVDEAGLFSADEIARLEKQILEFVDTTDMDFVVWTSRANRSESAGLSDADDYYDNHGYGLGERRSGGILFFDMDNRIPHFSTCGDMIDYITDERLEALWSDAFYNRLAMNDFAGATELFINNVSMYVQRGIPEGQYRYDVVTGKRTTASHKALTPGEIAFSVIAGIAVAAIIAACVSRSYKLKGSTYAYDVLANSDTEITEREDTYLRSTTRVIRKAESSGGSGGGRSGGSGTRTSSSGMSHGGGSGRKF